MSLDPRKHYHARPKPFRARRPRWNCGFCQTVNPTYKGEMLNTRCKTCGKDHRHGN